VSEVEEPKTFRKGVAVALGIICVILAVGLVGVIADYALIISDKDSTIASLKSQVSQLNINIANLQGQIDYLSGRAVRGVIAGFMLTMTLEKNQYSLGEPVNITMTLTNTSNQTVSFSLDYSYSYFQFLIYNDTNSTIYSSLHNGEPLLPLAVSYTLNAGQSMSDVYSWQQTIGSSLFVSPPGVPVSSGTYYIVGQVGPILPPILEPNSTIETTPIQITIS